MFPSSSAFFLRTSYRVTNTAFARLPGSRLLRMSNNLTRPLEFHRLARTFFLNGRVRVHPMHPLQSYIEVFIVTEIKVADRVIIGIGLLSWSTIDKLVLSNFIPYGEQCLTTSDRTNKFLCGVIIGIRSIYMHTLLWITSFCPKATNYSKSSPSCKAYNSEFEVGIPVLFTPFLSSQ